jgi:hypothetical protein
LAAVEHDLDIAQSSNRSREELMMDHSADIVRLEQIGSVLADRVDRAACRAINNPPAYLTRALGFLPDDGTPVGDWIEAATIIESYRLEHDSIDKRHALGREPRDPIDRSAWQEAAWTVDALISRSVPSIEVPDHDVGLELDL